MKTTQSRATVEEGLVFIGQDLVECVLDLPMSDRESHRSVASFAHDVRSLVDGADQWSYYGAFATDADKSRAFGMIQAFATRWVESDAWQILFTKVTS